MSTLREKSISYLSHREHSRLELKNKLLAKNFSEKEIDVELNFLISKDLQSDERFAFAYVRARKQAGFGPQRIELELRERGVSETLIAAAVDVRSSEWHEQMILVWQKKFPNKPQNKFEKAAQFRFLLYRGYTSEMINHLLFSR